LIHFYYYFSLYFNFKTIFNCFSNFSLFNYFNNSIQFLLCNDQLLSLYHYFENNQLKINNWQDENFENCITCDDYFACKTYILYNDHNIKIQLTISNEKIIEENIQVNKDQNRSKKSQDQNSLFFDNSIIINLIVDNIISFIIIILLFNNEIIQFSTLILFSDYLLLIRRCKFPETRYPAPSFSFISSPFITRFSSDLSCSIIIVFILVVIS